MIGVGARAVSEAGAVGHLSRQQLELFSISQLFTCIVDADDDALFFECTITPSARRAFSPLPLPGPIVWLPCET